LGALRFDSVEGDGQLSIFPQNFPRQPLGGVTVYALVVGGESLTCLVSRLGCSHYCPAYRKVSWVVLVKSSY